MSTSITEYHIHIDGESMTPTQLFRFAKGLVIAAQPLSPQNDPDLYRQFILAHRQIRKLQRKLRKAAGREKRIARELIVTKNALGDGRPTVTFLSEPRPNEVSFNGDSATLKLEGESRERVYDIDYWEVDIELDNYPSYRGAKTTITARVGYDAVDDHAQCKCVVENVKQ